jgi:hypothetical protein
MAALLSKILYFTGPVSKDGYVIRHSHVTAKRQTIRVSLPTNGTLFKSAYCFLPSP